MELTTPLNLQKTKSRKRYNKNLLCEYNYVLKAPLGTVFANKTRIFMGAKAWKDGSSKTSKLYYYQSIIN